jgi:hypothetical protein
MKAPVTNAAPPISRLQRRPAYGTGCPLLQRVDQCTRICQWLLINTPDFSCWVCELTIPAGEVVSRRRTSQRLQPASPHLADLRAERNGP